MCPPGHGPRIFNKRGLTCKVSVPPLEPGIIASDSTLYKPYAMVFQANKTGDSDSAGHVLANLHR